MIGKMRQGGFTLMELLIVVIIIGILVTLALPGFQRSMEVSRQAEARAMLGNIYQAERAFFAQQGSYATGVNANSNPLIAAIPQENDNTQYFYYTVVNDATGFLVQAFRKTTGGQQRTGRAPTWTGSDYRIVVDANGDFRVLGF